MRTFRNALLAGAAAMMLSGVFAVAAAEASATHLMTIRLPGGAVEQIRYAGDVPPKIEVSPVGTPADFGWPVAFFDADAPFAAIDRISAEMDQQMAAMLREANAVAANPGRAIEIDAGQLPPGSHSYTFVSNAAGNEFCARSVEITSPAQGQKPQVVSKTYGDCGGAHGVSPGVERSARPAGNPDVREIRYAPPAPANTGPIREASAAW